MVLEKKGCNYQGISDSTPTMQKVIGNCEGVQVVKNQKGQLGPVYKEKRLLWQASYSSTHTSFFLCCVYKAARVTPDTCRWVTLSVC